MDRRYARQRPLLGPAGQAALRDAAVLVVGAGGLGSPVLQYLAASGVGTLGVVDDDAVERSNLQRQTVHGEADVGRPKVESAREFVAGRNPDVTVEAHEARLDAENAGLVADYDLVVDCADNLPTRYVVNDACTRRGIPYVHGAVYRFEGHLAVFDGAPCYRCLFPEAPEGAAPDCAEAGVLGVLPGTVGTLQATEAIKRLVGVGSPPEGLVVYDAATATVDEVPLRADPDCPVCGEGPAESPPAGYESPPT